MLVCSSVSCARAPRVARPRGLAWHAPYCITPYPIHIRPFAIRIGRFEIDIVIGIAAIAGRGCGSGNCGCHMPAPDERAHRAQVQGTAPRTSVRAGRQSAPCSARAHAHVAGAPTPTPTTTHSRNTQRPSTTHHRTSTAHDHELPRSPPASRDRNRAHFPHARAAPGRCGWRIHLPQIHAAHMIRYGRIRLAPRPGASAARTRRAYRRTNGEVREGTCCFRSTALPEWFAWLP